MVIIDPGERGGRERHRHPAPEGREGADRDLHLRRRRAAAQRVAQGRRQGLRPQDSLKDLVAAVEAARTGASSTRPIVHDRARRGRPVAQRAAAQILQMLADRMQTRCVTYKLGLSTETVRTHTKRILAKLEALHAHAGRGDQDSPPTIE